MVDIRCSNVISCPRPGRKWTHASTRHGRVDRMSQAVGGRGRDRNARQEEPHHHARRRAGARDRPDVLGRAHARRGLAARHRRRLERDARRAPRRHRRARDRLHDLALRAEVRRRGCGLRVPHPRRPSLGRCLLRRLLLRRRAVPRRRRHLPRPQHPHRRVLDDPHLGHRPGLVDLGDDRARDRARPQLLRGPPRDPRDADVRGRLVRADADPRGRDHRQGWQGRQHADDVRPGRDLALRRSPAAACSVGSCSASSSSSASRRPPRSARSRRIRTARFPAP